jgi:type IV secretory pathway TraG/TraD family ATPase VirD4
LQDISQLQGLYGDKWRNFFANAGVVQTFNVTEPHTAEIIFNMLGVRTAVVRSASGGRGDGNHSSTNRSESFQATQRPLLFPDEVIRLPADQQLVFLRGLPPLKLHKLRYNSTVFWSSALQGAVSRREKSRVIRQQPTEKLIREATASPFFNLQDGLFYLQACLDQAGHGG